MGTKMTKLMSKDEDTQQATLAHPFYAPWSANRLGGIYTSTHVDLMRRGYAEGAWGSNTFQTRLDEPQRT